MTIILGAFGVICGVIGFMVLKYFLNGVALQLLWGWFIIPIFHLPPLSLLQAIGVGMVVSFLTKQYIPKGEGEGENETGKIILHIILSPLVAIVIGWIIHSFM